MFTNKLYIASLALLSLTATACTDSVEHYIADVDAPTFTGVNPETNIKAGLDSIIVS